MLCKDFLISVLKERAMELVTDAVASCVLYLGSMYLGEDFMPRAGNRQNSSLKEMFTFLLLKKILLWSLKKGLPVVRDLIFRALEDDMPIPQGYNDDDNIVVVVEK